MNKLPRGFLRFNKRLMLSRAEVCSFYSTKPAVKQDDSDRQLREKIEDTQRITHLFRKKPRVKKPQKPPFAKNLFVGKFDTDILTYPQLEKDELELLEANLKPVTDFFSSRNTNEIATFSNEFMDSLRRLYLFGLRAPATAGGRELTHTENCKFNEAISTHQLGWNLISNELLGIQAILKKGSDVLKAKYLPRLVSGEILTAFCAAEDGSYDPKFIQTRASQNPDGSWTLNGQKSWVINASNADLFIVVAETDSVHRDDLRESVTTAFVVEKQFGGITTQKCRTLLDCDVCDVHFSNTCIPAENVLGVEGNSQDVIASILTEVRLSTGSACTTVMRQFLKKFTEHCKNVSVGGVSIIESDSALTKIGDLVATTYAMESATYLTSLLLDHYENQDCEVEAAMVKVFSSERTVLSSLLNLDFFGAAAFNTDHWLNRIHREALGYSLLTESNETLKLMIGLFGIQHAGAVLHEKVKKSRNPFFYPWDAFKQVWINKRQSEDNPKLNLNLGYHLHPSLDEAARALEYCVLRLQYATELLLVRHGIEVVNDHQNLKRLAECAVDIYAMTASVGRASRSYCIGLRHADVEVMIATTYCLKAKERVQRNVIKICEGRYNTGDQTKKVVADISAKWDGYFVEHPLQRNF